MASTIVSKCHRILSIHSRGKGCCEEVSFIFVRIDLATCGRSSAVEVGQTQFMKLFMETTGTILKQSSFSPAETEQEEKAKPGREQGEKAGRRTRKEAEKRAQHRLRS